MWVYALAFLTLSDPGCCLQEANPFAYVEINGLKIPEPTAAYGLLWEAVCGHDAAKDGHMKISAKEALRNLSKHFSNASREQVGPTGSHAW